VGAAAAAGGRGAPGAAGGALQSYQFSTLEAYAKAAGQDRNSVLVDYDVFVNVPKLDRDPKTVQRLYSFSDLDFRLRPGSAAIDRGIAIPNVNDGFAGKAPDLGALEAGQPLRPEFVRTHPTAHQRCGTEFLVVVILLSILAFSLVGRQPPLMMIASRILLIPVIASIGYELLRLGARHRSNPVVKVVMWPGILVQKITTKQPTDDMIEVAIVSLEEAIKADGEAVPEGGMDYTRSPMPKPGELAALRQAEELAQKAEEPDQAVGDEPAAQAAAELDAPAPEHDAQAPEPGAPAPEPGARALQPADG